MWKTILQTLTDHMIIIISSTEIKTWDNCIEEKKGRFTVKISNLDVNATDAVNK